MHKKVPHVRPPCTVANTTGIPLECCWAVARVALLAQALKLLQLLEHPGIPLGGSKRSSAAAAGSQEPGGPAAPAHRLAVVFNVARVIGSVASNAQWCVVVVRALQTI